MKTVGGVVIAKLRVDRTEIEGEIDGLLSAKWSTWNTLNLLMSMMPDESKFCMSRFDFGETGHLY